MSFPLVAAESKSLKERNSMVQQRRCDEGGTEIEVADGVGWKGKKTHPLSDGVMGNSVKDSVIQNFAVLLDARSHSPGI